MVRERERETLPLVGRGHNDAGKAESSVGPQVTSQPHMPMPVLPSALGPL